MSTYTPRPVPHEVTVDVDHAAQTGLDRATHRHDIESERDDR